MKLDDWYKEHNQSDLFKQNLKFKLEEEHNLKWEKEHITYEGRGKGVYPEHTSPVLTVVEVKNGIPKIISSPSETNLDFKTFTNEVDFEDILITLEDKSIITGTEYKNNGKFVTANEHAYSPNPPVFSRRLKEGQLKKILDSSQKKGKFTYYLRDEDGDAEEKVGSYEIKTTTKKEIGSYKYNFNTTNIKHILFNEAPTYHDISEVVGSVEANKFRLIFNKTVATFDGWSNYDDWLQILLAQLCVYKLS